MLTYNDQLNREALNEQVCRQLLAVSNREQAMKASSREPEIKKQKAPARLNRGVIHRFRPYAYATLIALLTIFLATQVAVAAYGLLNSGGGGLGSLLR